jgi:hypothetical protein
VEFVDQSFVTNRETLLSELDLDIDTIYLLSIYFNLVASDSFEYICVCDNTRMSSELTSKSTRISSSKKEKKIREGG